MSAARSGAVRARGASRAGLRCCVALSYVGVLAFAPGVAAGRGAAPPPVRITASAEPWVALGGRAALTGSVTPHPAGIQLALQERQGASWVQVAAQAVRADGRFSFTTNPGKPGPATYRVVTAKGASALGTSAAVVVRVLHWTYLGSAYPIGNRGDWSNEPIVANGVRYARPVVLDAGCYNAWGGEARLDYSLRGAYETFTATLGLADDNDSGRTSLGATYSIVGDDRTLAEGTLMPGTSRRISVSLEGVSRLRLDMNDPVNTAGCGSLFTKVVFGDAQVLGP